MADVQALLDHAASGTTTMCRCWVLRRRDGRIFGFTDHDLNIVFDGITFKADSGLTAQSLQRTTGLAVDNTEALGALTSTAVTEADLVAGLFDGAEVESWLVNWASPDDRMLQFRGTLGEVQTGAGAFQAELRGMTERLNQPQGRIYQALCPARLGDAACGVALDDPAFFAEVAIIEVLGPARLRLDDLSGYAAEWFDRGRLSVMSGAGTGLQALIKQDVMADGGLREIGLWEDLRAPLQAGDMVRLEAGCDKRAQTCREKFQNFVNFRGFPHIPGEDWLMAAPARTGETSGGSRNS
ncbi:MAG: DUF2163 domain-containing protein [Pseudomonadota bacterium]